jgi:hypothetical protein
MTLTINPKPAERPIVHQDDIFRQKKEVTCQRMKPPRWDAFHRMSNPNMGPYGRNTSPIVRYSAA